MKPTLTLRQTQRLSLTPELRQALGLLQLSAVELAAKVQEALEGNLLLEHGEEEPLPEAQDASPAEAAETRIDWDSTAESSADSGWDEDEPLPEAGERAAQSLKEYLLWQLELARVSARDAAIGAALIDALNDDGYLTEPRRRSARPWRTATRRRSRTRCTRCCTGCRPSTLRAWRPGT